MAKYRMSFEFVGDAEDVEKLRVALERVSAVVTAVEEVDQTPVRFGEMAPCPHQGNSGDLINCTWIAGRPLAGEAACRYCDTALACLDSSLVGRIFCHPNAGVVPDYGSPVAVPSTDAVVRYNEMSGESGRVYLAAFYTDGRLVTAREIRGRYHKNGRHSYTELSIIAPADAILLCESRSTHRASDDIRYLRLRDWRAEIGKLSELTELPDADSVSVTLGVEVTPEVLKHIALYGATYDERRHWAELESLPGVATY